MTLDPSNRRHVAAENTKDLEWLASVIASGNSHELGQVLAALRGVEELSILQFVIAEAIDDLRTRGPEYAVEHFRDMASDTGLGRIASPSRRRPRRDDVVVYRVRIDIKGAKPPLWRRVDFASDLYLNNVHDVIQVAFGWTDSHLHRFSSGPTINGYENEDYLCPYMAQEEPNAIPTQDVRLDEVLVEPGDKLFYTYDFGDDWQHYLRLEACLPRSDGAPRATCVGGQRPGPPEDCGGPGGYEFILAAADPRHPDHLEAMAEWADSYEDTKPQDFDFTPCDLNEINNVLVQLQFDKDQRPPK